MKTTITKCAVLTLAASLALAAPVFAGGTHGDGHGHGSSHMTMIGAPGAPGDVDREIRVKLGEMFFSPSSIEVERGETIRFIVTNTGEFVHEFNIATAEMHREHHEEMMKMMETGALEADRINHAMMMAGHMAHDDPNSVLLEPGKAAEVIWTFAGDARIEVSCNVPGHRESGMIAPIRIEGRSS
ncbi:hypothetical protein DEA8626_01786 [Defluviimonas aquaemixtae]|uniref:Blue (type 1) copper domain-containing protein n=1 Tax=Albidovulum aquaemixtae TaxID=1542388 RepID=A0A2R8B6Q7_9RHOB|nr:plastocyanin/azurin family copper-binding protein [Defluviimonas aquaemixtae]SPH18254.1 hypothetical protein DEA8626_01786 [Defluviimonas aquaemixtae]